MNHSNPLPLVPNVETQKSINDHINEVLRKKRSEREYLCAAFIEETKLKPSECMLFEQTVDGVTKIWLEKKVSVNINPNDCNCDQALNYKKLLEKGLKLCSMIEKWRDWDPMVLKRGKTDFDYMACNIVPFADELKKQITKGLE